MRRISLLPVLALAALAAARPPVCPMPGLTDRCEVWSAVVDHEPGHASDRGADVLVATAASADGATVFAAGYSQSAAGDLDGLVLATEAATGATAWTRRYAGAADASDAFVDVALSLDGSRVYAVGSRDASAQAGMGDMLVAALDAGSGELLWATAYDGGGKDAALALAVGPAHPEAAAGSDIVYVTGQSDGEGTDAVTEAFEGPTGAIRWTDRFAEAEGFVPWDSTDDIAVSADGTRVFVAGSTYNGTTHTYDGLVIAYESGMLDDEERQVGGERGWVQLLPKATVYRVLATGDSVVVAGKTWRDLSSPVGGFEQSDLLAAGLEAETGEVRWTDRYSGASPTMGENLATAIAGSADPGRVYVAGIASGVTDADEDMVVIAYDVATGTPAWTAPYGAPGHIGDAPLALVETAGRVVVTGVSAPSVSRFRAISNPSVFVPINGDPAQADAATLGLDAATGDIVWTARYNASELGTEAGFAWSIVAAGERVVVAGHTGRVARAEDAQGSERNRYDAFLAAYAVA